jgi:hypothetical protein
MSDALERAIDNMADELAAMGKAMSRDSKRIEKLEAENARLRKVLRDIESHPEQERVQCRWNTPDTKPGDGDSIWVEVIEHDGVNRHVDYAVTWVDHDGLQVRRFEQNSRLFCQIWPPEDVMRWCHCRVPESSVVGGDDE